MFQVSALMTVYCKESPEFLAASIESVAQQTLLPKEFVIVKDGILGSALEAVIGRYEEKLTIVHVDLPENVGRGAASAIGLEYCANEFVARVDSDDICLPERFELQCRFLSDNPHIDVVGGALAEFESDPKKVLFVRRPPCQGKELERFARFRSPVNNQTSMFRRSAVMKAGNFHSLRDLEDYELWARMLVSGYRFYNLDEILVLARAGTNMFQRRGGLQYLKNDFFLQMYFFKIGFIPIWTLIYKIIANSFVRVSPQIVRSTIYSKFLRKPPA